MSKHQHFPIAIIAARQAIVKKLRLTLCLPQDTEITHYRSIKEFLHSTTSLRHRKIYIYTESICSDFCELALQCEKKHNAILYVCTLPTEGKFAVYSLHRHLLQELMNGHDHQEAHHSSVIQRTGESLIDSTLKQEKSTTTTDYDPEDELTPREKEILLLLRQGHMYKEVAVLLRIKLGTVKQHVHRIYCKLRVNNRTEAINLYYNTEAKNNLA